MKWSTARTFRLIGLILLSIFVRRVCPDITNAEIVLFAFGVAFTTVGD